MEHAFGNKDVLRWLQNHNINCQSLLEPQSLIETIEQLVAMIEDNKDSMGASPAVLKQAASYREEIAALNNDIQVLSLVKESKDFEKALLDHKNEAKTLLTKASQRM